MSIVASLFWGISQFINVSAGITSFVFEILWLPMIVLIFVLPIISFIYLIKEKFNYRSLNMYSFIISAGTLALLFLHDYMAG